MRKVKRLYSDFKPENYELFIEPDREKKTFTGKVKISGAKTGRPSQRITLHQKDLKIISAKLVRQDKKSGPVEVLLGRINTHKSLDELRLHSKQQLFPGQYQIELEFSGKITESMHGIYPCDFVLDGKHKQLIATQFESHHAREAFPCIDEPEAKAAFRLSLKTPLGETVISNTPVESQERDGKGLLTTFEKTPKMSTYLLAFAYGKLVYKEAKTKNGVKVRVYTTPDKVELTDFALHTAVGCLEFFEDYYGVPYPLPKLDLIGLPDFSAGAMENWGLVTFRESVLYIDPESSSVETRQYVALVICHELAHQWFGNLVTMKWWNDLWLNESFANLMEYRAVDELYPDWNIWREFVQREVGAALSRDSLPNVQALQAKVNHPDELATLFDPSIVYAKGGSLLNMVMHHVGEESFRKGLKTYFAEHKYANTEASDLWKHLKAASGVDIDLIMENWLSRPGYPVVEVEMNASKRQFLATQRRLVVSTKSVSDDTVWQVPLAPSLKSTPTLLAQKQADFKFQPKTDYPLTINHDGHSYFVARYTSREHLDKILSYVQRGLLSPIDRLLLIQNYLLLEKARLVSTMENVQLLGAYANEREETVWDMMSVILGNVRNLIGKDKPFETKLNEFVRPLVHPLVEEFGWKGSKDELAQTQKMRSLALSLAAVAENKPVINEGLRQFKNFKQPADLAPDVRGVVYFIGVRYGSKNDFDKLIDLYSSVANADEKDEIASGLSSTRDPGQISLLLQMLISGKVRLQDVPTWFAWLMRNHYATDQAWQWLNDNWEWVESKYASDKSYDRFPRYAGMVFSYPDQLKQYKGFFEPKSNIALNRAISLGIEEIEGRVAWRQLNESSVKDWLTSLAQ